MTGTWINIGAVLLGGLVGLVFGARFSERARTTVIAGMALFTIGIGVSLFLETRNPLFPLGGIVVGGLLGEALQVEAGLARLGGWLERRFGSRAEQDGSTFVRGFLTASLLFCVGPLTILGSIQDGLTGDYQLLAVKSVLDGFAALALASTLGPGVLFSVLVILVYQGALSLLAAQAQTILSESMTVEMTAVGGVLLIGLALGTMLELKPIRVGNLLPALVASPALVALAGWAAGWLRL